MIGERDTTILATLVALYSAALYEERRFDRLCLIGGATVPALESLLAVNQGRDVGEAIPPLAFFGAAVLIGRVMRSRKAMVVRLEEHTADLQKNRERDLQHAAERERARIARELHDVIAHCLSVIVVQAGAEGRLLADTDGRTRSTLSSIEQSGREAMTELRRLLGVIRSGDDHAPLTPQPGLDSVPGLVQQVRDAGLDVELAVSGDRRDLPPGIELSGFRIIQEALTNVVKHANASKAMVAIEYEPARLTLEVRDDGRGTARGDGRDHPISGFGLVGLKERVSLYGGEMEAGEGSDGGYTLRCVLPVSEGR